MLLAGRRKKSFDCVQKYVYGNCLYGGRSTDGVEGMAVLPQTHYYDLWSLDLSLLPCLRSNRWGRSYRISALICGRVVTAEPSEISTRMRGVGADVCVNQHERRYWNISFPSCFPSLSFLSRDVS